MPFTLLRYHSRSSFAHLNVLVVFPSLNVVGGAESLCLSTIRALRESDSRVTLLVLEKTRLSEVRKNWGAGADSLRGVDEIVVGGPRGRGIYKRFLDYFLLSQAMRQLTNEYDLTVNLKADDIPIPAGICYVHYPAGPAVYHGEPTAASVTDIKYSSKIAWKIYFQPYKVLMHFLSTKLSHSHLIVTNGVLSSNLIEKYYGIAPAILYPPFVGDRDQIVSQRGRNRVTVVSRFERNKELHLIVGAAERLPNLDFYILGRVDPANTDSRRYFLEMKDELARRGLSNIHLVPNVSDDYKTRLLANSAISVYPASYEHFGIGVLEAMSAGALVIVRKTSGAWKDIVAKGEYGFGFDTLSELVDLLGCLTTRNEVVNRYRELSVMRSMQFNYQDFKSALLSMIENVTVHNDAERTSRAGKRIRTFRLGSTSTSPP